MAVEFEAYVDGTASAGSTTAAVDFSARSVGELALVMVSRLGGTAPSAVPADWTLLQNHAVFMASWLYYKLLTADDLGVATWTWAASAATFAHGAVYSGQDAEAPIAASAKGTPETGDGSNLDCGSLDTDEPMVVALARAYTNSTISVNALAGWTERRDHWSTVPDHLHLIADSGGAWGGGTCAPDFTMSASYGSYRCGFLVAIAAGTAPPPAGGFMVPRWPGVW